MAMVRARQGRGAARPDAAARLQQLLAGAPGELVSGHPLLAASLSAALALDARGAKELAALLRDDPDPGVAAAARAETATVEMKAPAAPGDCFAAAAAARADGLDAGAPLDESPSELDLRRAEFQTAVLRAPSRAARPGCLAAQLASGADDRPSNVILDAARATLWSDDGDERVAACLLLARAGDSESAPLRRAFTHDPERRVRDACSRPSETASPVTR